MKTVNDNILTLEQFKAKNYGKSGSAKRDLLEARCESFKIGAMMKLV